MTVYAASARQGTPTTVRRDGSFTLFLDPPAERSGSFATPSPPNGEVLRQGSTGSGRKIRSLGAQRTRPDLHSSLGTLMKLSRRFAALTAIALRGRHNPGSPGAQGVTTGAIAGLITDSTGKPSRAG